MRRFVKRVAEFFTLQITSRRKIILANVYAFRKKRCLHCLSNFIVFVIIIIIIIITIIHLLKILPGRE